MTYRQTMTNLDTHKEIGARVHDLAFRQDVEQADIAEALGIHPSAVSLKVRGKRRWSVEELYALAALFDVPITDLLPDDGGVIRGYLPNAA